MDFTNPPEDVTPRSMLPSNRKRRADEYEDSSEIPPKRLRFSGPYLRQNWSIPESIIYYILKNPSSTNVYQKLIRTCKYFFSKNPITVCSNLNIVGRDTENGRIYDLKIVQDGIPVIIDLKNLTTKLWVTESIYIAKDIMSSIIPNIYRCDARRLWLGYQEISFNEYIFLASNSQDIQFKHVTIRHENGSIASLEELVEIAVKAKVFKLECSVTSPRISSATVKNLLQIPHFTSLDTLYILDTSDAFDFDTFFVYVKKNKKTRLGLRFTPSISEACKKRVEKFVDEIIDAEILDFKSPLIQFPGMDREKFAKLFKIYRRRQ